MIEQEACMLLAQPRSGLVGTSETITRFPHVMTCELTPVTPAEVSVLLRPWFLGKVAPDSGFWFSCAGRAQISTRRLTIQPFRVRHRFFSRQYISITHYCRPVGL